MRYCQQSRDEKPKTLLGSRNINATLNVSLIQKTITIALDQLGFNDFSENLKLEHRTI